MALAVNNANSGTRLMGWVEACISKLQQIGRMDEGRQSQPACVLHCHIIEHRRSGR